MSDELVNYIRTELFCVEEVLLEGKFVDGFKEVLFLCPWYPTLWSDYIMNEFPFSQQEM